MFQELADNAPVMIWRSGTDKLCNWFNRPWLKFVGRSLEEESGYGWAEGVHPDDLDRCVSIYNNAFDARENFSMTYRLRRYDGVYRWLLDTGAPYFREGRFAGYFGSCVDVSEQQEAHDLVVRALAQRDALLREVYHRVKNNLQQIEGLIAVEGLTLTDPKALHALASLSGRVRAMGAVHQRLISAKNLDDISARDFISDLCADVARSQGADKRGIAIHVEADAGDVNIERAFVLGLLINELTTNALKHAFSDGRSGNVVVRYAHGDAETTLEIRDDGIGMPPEMPLSARAEHSGFRLIDGFVDQLDGKLTIERVSGSSIRVTLPRSDRKSS